ncbi:MAG: ribosomal L7Ae/L30e/S12e/Gadd45 family protein [Oscillospiraceae bacterium]|nr:ribosomal L7Ae/L30e/S12e/Gadd45 family protein [Oscillospiraceae bacterium]MBR1897622.1 ribosomal L7Ae/L30e/S12e/Gadd45 family protein [Oscillospiraceae bacterium]
MSLQKLTGILSICRKAGKMEIGFAPMKEALDAGRVRGVIVTEDASPKTYKEVCYFCGKKQVPVQRLPMTMEMLGGAIGRKAAVAAILDEGFFGRIEALCAGNAPAAQLSE